MKTFLLLLISSNAFSFTYRQVNGIDGQVSTAVIQRIEDSAFIPADPENRDYKEFLVWKKQGNQIQPPLVETSADPRAGDKATVKDKNATTDQKLNAVISILGLDK